MLERIGIFLMEESGSKVSVQLFSNPDDAKSLFVNLKGKPSDKPSRATLITVDYKEKKSDIEVRDLPDLDDPEKRPDGYRLGEGPVWLPKEEENDQDSSGS